MFSYLRWCLTQFYKVFFLPTLFRAETKKLRWRKRFSYITRLLPVIILLICLGNGIVGYILTAFGKHYNWTNFWPIIGVSVVISVTGGVVANVVVGMVVSVVYSVIFSLAYGLGASAALSATCGVVISINVGLAIGLIDTVVYSLSLDMGVDRDVVFGVGVSAVLGVVSGVGAGMVYGVSVGMAVGVSAILCFIVTYFRLLWYPIDLFLSIFSFIFAHRQPKNAFVWFKVCPVSWNEVIWLPLPFLTKFLILLTKQDYQKGLDKITFVASQRSLQRRSAVSALIELTLEEISNCKSVKELSTLSEKLVWVTDVPAGLLPNLPLTNIDSISRQTAQYLTAVSNYTKKEAIKKAINEVDNLKKSLVFTPGYGSQLLKALDSWQYILKKEEEKILSFIITTEEIPNPFIFGNPIEETETNLFVGRRDIVKEIEHNLIRAEHSPTLLLYGARRMGKSSVLNQLPRLLGKEFIPVDIDLQSAVMTENLTGLLSGLSEAVSKTVRQRYIQVDALRREELGNSPYAVFSEWLDKVESRLPESKILIALDEYEKLEDAVKSSKIGIEILDELRHITQHHRKFSLLLVGSHLFSDMEIKWTSYFISAKNIHISYLKPEETNPLITKPIPEFNLRYTNGTIEEIIRVTNCQPFLVQSVCFELVIFLNKEHRRESLLSDVDIAISNAIKSGDAYFGNLWSDAGELGQKILSHISAMPEGVEILEIAKGVNLSVEQIKPVLTYLCRNDVLKNVEKERYQFCVPMVARWILENKE